MPPDPELQRSSSTETAAETLLVLSADDTGRIPFPEGNYREIATFLEALTRLDKKGHIEHRVHNGYLGCYLTDSGNLLRSQLTASQTGDSHDTSGISMLHQSAYQVFLPALLGLLLETVK